MDPLADWARDLLASMQANRMAAFGWEDHVNQWPPAMLRKLAQQMPEHRQVLLMAAACAESRPHE